VSDRPAEVDVTSATPGPTTESTPAASGSTQRSVGTDPRLLGLPATAAGWWAFALEIAFVGLFVAGLAVNSASMQTALWGRLGFVSDVMLFATPVALLASLVGGVLAVSSLVRKRERSILVWFAAAAFVLAVGVVVLSLV
jgi:hypothetical protein